MDIEQSAKEFFQGMWQKIRNFAANMWHSKRAFAIKEWLKREIIFSHSIKLQRWVVISPIILLHRPIIQSAAFLFWSSGGSKLELNMKILGSSISLTFVAIGIYLTMRRIWQTDKRISQTERNLAQNDEARLDTRFKDAVILLGNDQRSVRVGGLYTLLEIAKSESKKIHEDNHQSSYPKMVVEIICGFIRNQSQLDYEAYLEEVQSYLCARYEELKKDPNVFYQIFDKHKGDFRDLKDDLKDAPELVNFLKIIKTPFENYIREQPHKIKDDIQTALNILFLSHKDDADYNKEFDVLEREYGGKDEYWVELSQLQMQYRMKIFTFGFGEAFNLSNAKLQSARLNYANLQFVQLHSAHLQHAKSRGANLQHALLNYAHLQHAQLNYAHLQHAQLNHAHLEYAELNYAHLQHAEFNHAYLEHAKLKWAKLQHAKLNYTHLQDAKFEWAKSQHAEFNSAHFQHADLARADFFGAFFIDADFEYAHLYETDFRHARLVRAEFPNANLQNTELYDADFLDAKLKNAKFRNTDLTHVENLKEAVITDDGKKKQEITFQAFYQQYGGRKYYENTFDIMGIKKRFEPPEFIDCYAYINDEKEDNIVAILDYLMEKEKE